MTSRAQKGGSGIRIDEDSGKKSRGTVPSNSKYCCREDKKSK
jgi:hypothetical protein